MFLILLLIELAVAASNVFPEEPADGEGTVFVPVNSTTTFRCTVAIGYTVSWEFQRPDTGNPVTISQSTGQFELSAGILDKSSMLTVHDITVELNGSSVFCVATEEEDIFSNEVREVVVIVYGPPPSPTNLVANVSTNTLDISWSFTSIPEVPVNFSLTINTSESIHSEVVMEQHYVFNTGSGRCTPETYQVQVVAMNPAGSSNPAEVSVTLPPVLDLSPVMDLLKYSLTRDSPGIVQLNVSFQNDNPCPDSTVNYTLKLEEVMDEFATSDEHEPSISNSLVTFLVNLEADTKYQFYIEAMNEFGNSSLEPISIVTTDVQGVSLCQLNETSFSITCTFLSGSTARGCFYTVVSTSNDRSVSGRIERGNSSEGAADLSVYDEVILLAWDSDGTNGTTPVRLDLNISFCPTTEGNQPGGGGSGFNAAAVAVPLIVILVVLVLVLLIVVCRVLYKKGLIANKTKMSYKIGGMQMGESSQQLRLEHSTSELDNEPEVRQFNVETERAEERANGEVETEAGQEDDINHMYSCLTSKPTSPHPPPQQEVPEYAEPPGALKSPTVPAHGYAELNQGPIYHVLENPKEPSLKKKKKPSPRDSDISPPIPAYCPAGGDSPKRDPSPPVPQIAAPSPLLQAPSLQIPPPSEYAEITGGGAVR